ncbi:MAG: pyrroline-5-carboxylate reductase [Phycisphaeraceae bacterium]|nr:pyrroline-5-carboxylate reductase [Phycisphaeraceae bacterium]
MMHTLGFIGAGNMAEAIARGAIDKGVLPPEGMIASDPSAARRELFKSLGVTVTQDNAEVVRLSQQIMLAVKPQMFSAVAGLLAEQLRDEQIVISIMAGMSTQAITMKLSSLNPQASPPRLIRVMPNTPMMVSRGMAGVCVGENAVAGDETLTMKLFGSAGKAVLVPESAMDAITAVSGSGPAYLYYLAEAMQEAAAKLGLADQAALLVNQTLLGAAEMLVRSHDPAGELRRKVTSPGGTTEAALKLMEQRQVKAAVVDAIAAAEQRGKELGS